MKKKFSYKDILYKGKRMAVLALVLVFGTGIVVSSNLDRGSEVPVHDGEVLVDSLAVEEVSTPTESETASGSGSGEESGEKTDEENRDDGAGSPGSFEEMRAQMTLERNKLISTLDSTINNSSNENEKKNASEEKKRIMDYMETELAIESIIKSKNLPPSFVLITESSVSVTVDKQELDTNTVAKICDIVMRETGKPANKIVVQSKY